MLFTIYVLYNKLTFTSRTNSEPSSSFTLHCKAPFEGPKLSAPLKDEFLFDMVAPNQDISG